MNRALLQNALRDLAVAAGYEFHAADDPLAPATIGSYPAAWLSPPKLYSVEGRKHGRISYDIVLHLLGSGFRLSPDERNRLWNRMEADALEIFTALSENDSVIAVENLEISPRTSAMTNHGDISQSISARVVTCF